jgi:predicted transglutaminase-like cysteine proteinase
VNVLVGGTARAPIGWVEFCNENPQDCVASATRPRDVVLTSKVWKDLVSVNRWVNKTIQPVTDLEHWGVVERWSYPDDGKGDCEDFVAHAAYQSAGWRAVAADHRGACKKDEGHAVLTVKTDKGDFVLDNQAEEILHWIDTGYRFVKRQSQSNPNIWVELGDPRPAAPTVATSTR